MTYYFDYGFVKDQKWLDGIHKQEKYDDGKMAFARYCAIQREGKKREEELRSQGMLPEGNRFICTLDIRDDKGNWNHNASFQFFLDAFSVLSSEQTI